MKWPHLANQIGVVYRAILMISCAENVTENTEIDRLNHPLCYW